MNSIIVYYINNFGKTVIRTETFLIIIRTLYLTC